jgi:hypothetical protein
MSVPDEVHSLTISLLHIAFNDNPAQIPPTETKENLQDLGEVLGQMCNNT